MALLLQYEIVTTNYATKIAIAAQDPHAHPQDFFSTVARHFSLREKFKERISVQTMIGKYKSKQ